MTARDENGRFIKGQSGNPQGRPPREREEKFFEITLATVTYADWKQVIKKAAEQAKRGDATARKFLADYVIGPPTQKHEVDEQSDRTIRFVWENELRYSDLDEGSA